MVKPHAGKQIELLVTGLPPLGHEGVVVPGGVSCQQHLVTVHKEVAQVGQSGGEAGNQHRQGKILSPEGWILLQQLFPPQGTQVGIACGGGVGHQLLGGKVRGLFLDAGQHNWFALVDSHADGGIGNLSQLFCLVALGDDALGKIHPATEVGQQLSWSGALQNLV